MNDNITTLKRLWFGAIIVIALVSSLVALIGGEDSLVNALRLAFYVGIPVIAGGWYYIFRFLPERNRNKNLEQKGGIKLPRAIFPCEDKKYSVIENVLRSVGFTNIETINLHDMKIGILQKNYTVESITIDGEKVTHCGNLYLPNAKIVITYHAK